MQKNLLLFLLIILGFSCEKGLNTSDKENLSVKSDERQAENDSGEIPNAQKKKFADLQRPMDEAKFWQIVERSHVDFDTETQLKNIGVELQKLKLNEILGFEVRMHMLLHASYSSKLMCAGEILHHNCPSFDFEAFRCWIILHGKETFYKAKSNPNSLIEHFGPEENCYSSGDFHRLTARVVKEVHECEIIELIDPVKFPYFKSNYPKLSIAWNTEDPASMRAVCPQLFDACWH